MPSVSNLEWSKKLSHSLQCTQCGKKTDSCIRAPHNLRAPDELCDSRYAVQLSAEEKKIKISDQEKEK